MKEYPKGTITVTAARLRLKLTELLGKVRHGGQRVLVTRHGKPACALVPLEDLKKIRQMDLAINRAKRNKTGAIPLSDLKE